MTQHLFNSDAPATGSDKGVLDGCFTDLYDLREHISTPSYTATTPWATFGAGGILGLGMAPTTVFDVKLTSGMARFGSSSGNNLMQVYSSGGVLGMWAGGGSTIYSNGALGFAVGMTTGTAFPTGGVTAMTLDTIGNLGPGADNTQKLGVASGRWSTIYAGTGTINTSDAREKTAVAPLTTAEIAAAQDLVSQIGVYQWLSAVQAKGEGDARKHVGMTVQQAITVMTSHGLDPMSYGFICYDSWTEQRDADGKVTLTAGDRYSFRPDELGMFIARGVGAALAAMNTRLLALEAR